MSIQRCHALIAGLAVAYGSALYARTEAVPVKIRIEGSRGGPAYVALVPPDRPWSLPAAEKVATGPTVTLEVPEGTYRAVAGIRGAGLVVSDLINVAASRKNEARMILPPMRVLTGTVRDEKGRPLSGVTIGEVEGLVEAPLGKASELAAGYFQKDWRVRSAADGTWSLSSSREQGKPIAAESPGYATAWKSGKEAAAGSLDLVMQRGAGLRLTLDREAPEFVVTLEAKGDTALVPQAWQAQFWARRAVKRTIEWSSLAPGDYDIYVQQSDPRVFSDAMKLGSATLQVGEPRELRLEMPQPKAASKSVATVLVRPNPRFDPARIVAFGRDSGGSPAPMRSVAEQVSGGTLMYLDTTGMRPPYFGTTLDRFVVLPARDDGRLAIATVRDLGGASLDVRSPNADLPIPSAAMVTFHGCGTPETIEASVAVSKRGRIAFVGPAGCMSFVLDLEPFSPMVFAKELALGEPQWLGQFTLYASGGAAVRVATADGAGVPNAMVSVSARTEGTGQESVQVAQRTTGADGWARFDRLPAGPELAVAARTADGDPSVVERFRVAPAQQRLVDPLKVPKPASLVVQPSLDRSFLEQFPDGRLDTIFLEPLDDGRERRTETAGDTDHVEFRRLLPGRWQLGAIVGSGRGYQPVFGDQLEVKDGEAKRIEAVFTPLVFHGRVYGKLEDLTGNIHILSSKRSDPVPSVEVASTGEFVAILPHRDSYFVGVQSRKTNRMMWVGNTAFSDPAVPVEVRLPEGVIVARLHADGRPLAGAMVMARMQQQPTTDVPLVTYPMRTGEDGEARIEGLLPGQWIVFVADNRQGQKSVTVSPTEVTYADLDVTKGLAVNGSVQTAFGAAVAGAKVTCLMPGADGVPYMRLAFTGADGSFDMSDRLSSRTSVLCSVASFSGAQGFRVVAGDATRLMLPANPAALQVMSLPEMARFSSLWLVSSDGRVIEVSPFVPRLPGAVALTIPALAPEAWKLVRVSTPLEWMALTTGGGALPAIVDVTLAPDERKTVDLRNAGRHAAPAN